MVRSERPGAAGAAIGGRVKRPLCIELFAGLHGWGEAFVDEGYRVAAFDIVDMCAFLGKPRPKGIDLVIQDVLTLHGSQFKNAAVIVASPPCQAFSYMAMPWTRVKNLAKWYRDPEAATERIAELTALFDACFRIQREASEAAGEHVPLIVENVKGAQPWVGAARWHFGSFYLWGDVPAIMPIGKHRKQDGDSSWFYANYEGSARRFSSHSQERREWSALIAKIPYALASHIAKVYKPQGVAA